MDGTEGWGEFGLLFFLENVFFFGKNVSKIFQSEKKSLKKKISNKFFLPKRTQFLFKMLVIFFTIFVIFRKHLLNFFSLLISLLPP